ncbi:fimbria/pilus outer membrane usher protein [Herbaspirillum lusitanum]|uniref:fimbria/pilus outer membrane usher protein n=1 Tax=Herbaspirillum lusitanum TaxID=213312 RepID=UPI00037255FF|nr:fimbria/pilus outer membrane usher protein [Herbaspirillum lusitanum]
MEPIRQTFKRKPLCNMILVMLAALPSWAAHAEKKPTALAQAQFNDQFLLRKDGKSVDLSRFKNGNPVQAGTYRADVYVNEAWMGRSDVVLRSVSDDPNNVVFCADRSFLDMAGVDFEKLSPEALAAIRQMTPESCLKLEDLIPSATALFDNAELRLNVSLPQISVRRQARGYVNPEFWDRGVNAAILGYNFNAYRTSTPGLQSSTSYYLGLNGGVNLGDWRLRNFSALTKQSSGDTRFQNTATYLQRDLTDLKSQLTIGDTFTPGQFFDSFSFRGVRLASDDRMLPDSLSGYAPAVRGIARTNAKVTVSQSGNILYETTVAPGQFEINDLYATGYGGDLSVVITEADGSRSSFTVPYASVAQLLRPGVGRYSVTAGRTRDNGLPQVNFVQATYERGMTNSLTLFGGAQVANDYLSAVGGTALNTGIGAFSASVTQSNAKVSEQDVRSGQSYRADYSKLLKDIGTNLSLAAYRYSSSGFMRLQDLLQAKDLLAKGFPGSRIDRQRSQLQLLVNQSLGEKNGSFYLSSSMQNYWNRDGSTMQYQAGYNNNWKMISYSVYLQRQKDLASGATSTQYYASASMPLGREVHSPTLSTSVSKDSAGGSSLQSTLSGVLGEDNAFSYGVSASKSPFSSNASVNGQYRAAYANVGGSYGYTNGGATQMSAQASGAIVAHPGGVTLAQSVGETIGIVEARDAEGASVNTAGVRVDGRGYAVVPYMTPYRLNEIAIDPKGSSTDVELALTSQRVAPRAGAVVMLKYPTVTGRSILFQVTLPNGDGVPFGAEVLDAQGNSVGLAGQGGRVFVRASNEDQGKLLVRWGEAANAQCSVQYQLPPRPKDAKGIVFDTAEARCEFLPQEAGKKQDLKIGKTAGTSVTR